MRNGLSTFFVVGAPRCGTTAVSKMLGGHEQVCFSYPKETHFFVREREDLAPGYLDRAFVDAFFPHLAPHHRMLGEGSPSHLYSSRAIRAIDAFDRAAKFIVCVRNPTDMVHSLHARLLYMMDEDVGDFAAAWALQAERAAGKHVPARCRDPRLLLYGEIGRHAAHLEELFGLVGRERCRVVVFDDLARDARAVYRDLCAFLGLPDDHRRDFPAKKTSREFKRAFLQQLLVNPPGPLRPALHRLMFSSNPWARALWRNSRVPRKWLKRRNSRIVARRPLPPKTRVVLNAHFAPDVERLGRLLNRDLSHWR